MIATTSLLRRPPRSGSRALLAVALLVLAGVGWVGVDVRMRGMDAGPGTDLGTLGFYTTAWVVMMAAMMFPSIVPMTLGYAPVEAGRRGRGRDPARRPRSSPDIC